MSRSKEYKAAKNYIHNELGLSRDYIREIMIPLIKETIDSMEDGITIVPKDNKVAKSTE